MCGCSAGFDALFHNRQLASWRFTIIPSGDDQICTVKIDSMAWKFCHENMDKSSNAHISGRATAAALSTDIGIRYIVAVYRYNMNE